MEPTPTIRVLARELIALETSQDARPAESGSPAGRVCEKLRAPFIKFAGQAGYQSLISRALAIAKHNTLALGPVEVDSDGSLVGLDEVAGNGSDPGTAVLIQLLNLLVTFIGEPLTLVLVRDAWPDANLEKTDLRTEERA